MPLRRFWGPQCTRGSRSRSDRKGPQERDETTLKHSSLGRTKKGSFFSLGLTIWWRKLKVWWSQVSTKDHSHASFSCRDSVRKCNRASLRIGSSGMSSVATWYKGIRVRGVGLGAGVGGDAGADGRSGFGSCGDMEVGGAVLGVSGGFGCTFCSCSFLLDCLRPIPGVGEDCLVLKTRSSSESSEGGLGRVSTPGRPIA